MFWHFTCIWKSNTSQNIKITSQESFTSIFALTYMCGVSIPFINEHVFVCYFILEKFFEHFKGTCEPPYALCLIVFVLNNRDLMGSSNDFNPPLLFYLNHVGQKSDGLQHCTENYILIHVKNQDVFM